MDSHLLGLQWSNRFAVVNKRLPTSNNAMKVAQSNCCYFLALIEKVVFIRSNNVQVVWVIESVEEVLQAWNFPYHSAIEIHDCEGKRCCGQWLT